MVQTCHAHFLPLAFIYYSPFVWNVLPCFSPEDPFPLQDAPSSWKSSRVSSLEILHNTVELPQNASQKKFTSIKLRVTLL